MWIEYTYSWREAISSLARFCSPTQWPAMNFVVFSLILGSSLLFLLSILVRYFMLFSSNSLFTLMKMVICSQTCSMQHIFHEPILLHLQNV